MKSRVRAATEPPNDNRGTRAAVRFATCLLALAACTPPIADALRDARAATGRSPDVLVLFQERGGSALGARDIEVRGDGRVELRTWRPGFTAGDPTSRGVPRGLPDAESSLDVTAADVRSLLDLVLEIEGWEQRARDELPSPALEQARVWLKLRAGSAYSEIWEHRADLEAMGRLVRLRSALEELLARATPTDATPTDATPATSPREPTSTEVTNFTAPATATSGDEDASPDEPPTP